MCGCGCVCVCVREREREIVISVEHPANRYSYLKAVSDRQTVVQFITDYMTAKRSKFSFLQRISDF